MFKRLKSYIFQNRGGLNLHTSLVPDPSYTELDDLHVMGVSFKETEDDRILFRAAVQADVTVEFRLFQFDAPADGKQNGLHAGQLKSYIQLCLALSQMAKTVRTASPKPQQNENPKYAMRTWLLRLGFIGDEFKTARELLTKRLDGDAAFRSGRTAA